MLGFDRQQLGRFTMRQFKAAVEGYSDKSRERWEQAQMISWYAAFDRKPMRLEQIPIPGGNKHKVSKKDQSNKKDLYSLLEKWNK